MLTQAQANQFAQESRTISDNILKEHYQIYLLDILFDSNLGSNLVFKGGTALKLVYNSFRYSEDLDFSLSKEIDFEDFKKMILKITSIFPEAAIKDIYDKKNTLFARVSFTLDYKPIPIGVKVEINKEIKERNYEVKIIKSPFNNLVVTGNVFNLEEILKDKMRLLEERKEPRDLFDIWYINQTLGKQTIINDKYKYSTKEVMDRLNPFIPQNHKNILSLFTK